MNDDDFLNRLRKAPPPEFLTGLKARLDRQPQVPPLRQSGFGRGLIVGFLVAGVAFAATSISLTGLPTSPGRFFSAPVEFLARAVTGRNNSERDTNHAQIKAVPLGSAWVLPPHVKAQPAVATDTDSAVAVSGSNASAAPEARSEGPSSGAAARTSWGLVFAAQRELYSFAQASLQGLWAERVKLVEEPSTAVFASLCSSNLPNNLPDFIETTRRIVDEPDCKRVHPARIMEFKIGYQAVVLARSRLYSPLYPSARDVFLALAKRVPNPQLPGQLIDNPYLTWNEIDPALPNDAIKVYGPPQNSPAGRLATELLLDAGCNTFPELVALREHDDPAFETVCRKFRTDGTYAEVSLNGETSETDILDFTPTVVGIYTLQSFLAERGRLNANPIDGIVPEYTTLASHQYPASRTLYVYAYPYGNDTRASWLLSDLIDASFLSASFSSAPPGSTTWGFVELSQAESFAARADLKAQKTVQFQTRRRT